MNAYYADDNGVTGRLLVAWPDIWRRHLAARQARFLKQRREDKSA